MSMNCTIIRSEKEALTYAYAEPEFLVNVPARFRTPEVVKTAIETSPIAVLGLTAEEQQKYLDFIMSKANSGQFLYRMPLINNRVYHHQMAAVHLFPDTTWDKEPRPYAELSTKFVNNKYAELFLMSPKEQALCDYDFMRAISVHEHPERVLNTIHVPQARHYAEMFKKKTRTFAMIPAEYQTKDMARSAVYGLPYLFTYVAHPTPSTIHALFAKLPKKDALLYVRDDLDLTPFWNKGVDKELEWIEQDRIARFVMRQGVSGSIRISAEQLATGLPGVTLRRSARIRDKAHPRVGYK